ncbi:RNA polymerase sigma-70 factor (ECF subfamily) [Paenibacillus shirakamiensis]|uniref:RNA polymerase sigma-70 factor (ECF subfamily) n=1 Tax=Paenibacillus shirakamiensis TaxID=1265935 RepID=A0ABS4JJL6_9BACL|nr:RNA polymerase sigma-70 factor (ECF subfamily) [Paenibacillus shirakamiensis]
MSSQEEQWTQIHMNKLYHYLVKRGASREDAKDIVQEAFYRSFLYASGIPIAQRAAWIFKVALHLHYDMHRVSHRTRAFSPTEETTSSERTPEDHCLHQESIEDLHRVMNTLSPTYKTMLQLRYDEEQSYQEISDAMNMTPSTVKTYLARAKKQLAKLYRRLNNHE